MEQANRLTEAEALHKLAEAERSFAEAEKIRQEVALQKAKADARRVRVKVEIQEMRAQAIIDAMTRLSEAVSRIRQQGGDVSFDLEQLVQLIFQGGEQYPSDSELREASRMLPEDTEDL